MSWLDMKDISSTQTNGNKKNSPTAVSKTGRAVGQKGGELIGGGWGLRLGCPRRAPGALPQFEPMPDEQGRQRVGDDPQDQHQRRRFADVRETERLQVRLHLE